MRLRRPPWLTVRRDLPGIRQVHGLGRSASWRAENLLAPYPSEHREAGESISEARTAVERDVPKRLAAANAMPRSYRLADQIAHGWVWLYQCRRK